MGEYHSCGVGLKIYGAMFNVALGEAAKRSWRRCKCTGRGWSKSSGWRIGRRVRRGGSWCKRTGGYQSWCIRIS